MPLTFASLVATAERILRDEQTAILERERVPNTAYLAAYTAIDQLRLDPDKKTDLATIMRLVQEADLGGCPIRDDVDEPSHDTQFEFWYELLAQRVRASLLTVPELDRIEEQRKRMT